MLKKFFMASCAMMIVCSPAFAGDKKPMGMGPVDANNDGTVSTTEAMGAADKQFSHLDANKDGKITKDEFAAGGKAALAKAPPKFLEKNKDKIEASRKKRFEMLDAEKSGKITKVEMQADMQARHKKMDSNGDGNVTKDELVAFHKSMKPKKEAK